MRTSGLPPEIVVRRLDRIVARLVTRRSSRRLSLVALVRGLRVASGQFRSGAASMTAAPAVIAPEDIRLIPDDRNAPPEAAGGRTVPTRNPSPDSWSAGVQKMSHGFLPPGCRPRMYAATLSSRKLCIGSPKGIPSAIQTSRSSVVGRTL